MKKKYLVTGGAGFIGSNLVDKLLEDNHHVIVIDNESAECHENFYWNNNAENHILDICNFDSINDLFKEVDTVFHIAAEARIQPSLINPLKTIHTNVLGTANVLQACKENKVRRVIYSSTSSAYGRVNSVPFKENMKNDCLTPYSLSKVTGEELCTMYYKLFSLETVILRYFNVYGERQPTKGQYAPIIGLFQTQINNSKKMTIVGDGTQRRDFTHISDVVSANILASKCENEKILGSLINIGTGINYSIMEIANMIGEQNYEFIPARVGELKETLSDITKAKNMLEWQPKVCLKEWIDANRK